MKAMETSDTNTMTKRADRRTEPGASYRVHADVSRDPWYAEGDAWVLTQKEWTPECLPYFESVFSQSNGYLGVRGTTEEPEEGAASFLREGCLAGISGEMDEEALKKLHGNAAWPMSRMITIPDLFACTLTLNGETFSHYKGRVTFFSRSLNMRDGVLSRHIVWISPAGRRTRLLFERFLSASQPHLALQQITVYPENWEGTAACEFLLDSAMPAHGGQAMLLNVRVDPGPNGVPNLTFEDRGTGHVVSMASTCRSGGQLHSTCRAGVLSQRVTLLLQEGIAGSIQHAVAVTTSGAGMAGNHVPALASEIAHEAAEFGYEAGLAESQAVWDHRWSLSDIVVDGSARDQALVRFNVFGMLQATPYRFDKVGIPLPDSGIHAAIPSPIGHSRSVYDDFIATAGRALGSGSALSHDGVHVPAFDKVWQIFVLGFLGLRPVQNGIVFEPRLPDVWEGIALTIVYRGYRIKLSFSSGSHHAEVEGSEGIAPAFLLLGGERYLLTDGLHINKSIATAKEPGSL